MVIRLSFAPVAGGSVRQFSEQSDHGERRGKSATSCTIGEAGPEPKNGAEVLQRMHDAYAGKWYANVHPPTQKTTQFPPDKAPVALDVVREFALRPCRSGAQLRIDTPDCFGRQRRPLYRRLELARARRKPRPPRQWEPILPMIEGVDMQPVERTMRELKTTNIDMQKVTSGRWHDRPVWIVGYPCRRIRRRRSSGSILS